MCWIGQQKKKERNHTKFLVFAHSSREIQTYIYIKINITIVMYRKDKFIYIESKHIRMYFNWSVFICMYIDISNNFNQYLDEANHEY